MADVTKLHAALNAHPNSAPITIHVTGHIPIISYVQKVGYSEWSNTFIFEGKKKDSDDIERVSMRLGLSTMTLNWEHYSFCEGRRFHHCVYEVHYDSEEGHYALRREEDSVLVEPVRIQITLTPKLFFSFN